MVALVYLSWNCQPSLNIPTPKAAAFTMDNTAYDTIDKDPEPITLDAIERAKALGRGEVLPELRESTEGDPNKLLDFYLDD